MQVCENCKNEALKQLAAPRGILNCDLPGHKLHVASVSEFPKIKAEAKGQPISLLAAPEGDTAFCQGPHTPARHFDSRKFKSWRAVKLRQPSALGVAWKFDGKALTRPKTSKRILASWSSYDKAFERPRVPETRYKSFLLRTFFGNEGLPSTAGSLCKLWLRALA